MPVSNLPMNNITDVPYNGFTLGAGATKMAAMNTNDAETGYIFAGVNNTRQCFNVTWPADVVGGSINSIKVHFVVRQTGSDQIHIYGGVRNASDDTEYDAGVLPEIYSAFTSGALSRPGGGSWTFADCADGVTYYQLRLTSAGAGNGRATYGYLILDYVPGGSSFIPLLSVVASAIGSGLGLQHMPGLATAIWRRTRSWLRPDEYVSALKSWRLHRQPRSVFLGMR